MCSPRRHTLSSCAPCRNASRCARPSAHSTRPPHAIVECTSRTHAAHRCTQVIYTSAEGAAFYGKFDKAGRPYGPGAYTFANGNVVSGRYVAEEIPEADSCLVLQAQKLKW